MSMVSGNTPKDIWGRWGIRWTAYFQRVQGEMSFVSCFRLFSKFMILSNASFKADFFLITMNLRLTV